MQNPNPLLDSTGPILDIFLTALNNTTNRTSTSNYKFPVDVLNEEKTIYVYAELPSVKKQDISVDFYNNKLTIKVEKVREYETPGVSEIKYGQFERVITLPICVTSNRAVSVNYDNGLLKIRINKLVEEENKFTVRID